MCALTSDSNSAAVTTRATDGTCEAALAQALNCDRERVSWFEGSGEEQLLRVDFCLYAAEGTESDAEARCALLGGTLAGVESAARRSALNAFHGHLHSCTATQLASEKRACYAWK